ncbi:Xaa-Pro peptidase family protein [Paenibacillus sp. UMB4589-SE434]|uniref:M24 family metallopeptidase n=1 Tax=Paenibacillus sp. UMB4589-SE434 TaxID=3046314 RepID=UPI002551B627|nr:Xaa-Pro peptidase family protein [Paenibacillus sp. UMB4589-SE434]MDK8183152.1 Xaa-Pro peptidase family protein [Paenibacillus sp. UMB4589-SE434]
MTNNDHHDSTEAREHRDRLMRLQHHMSAAGIDLFVVTHNVDIYYLTGSMQTGYVMVPRAGEPVFLVKRSFSRAEVESSIRVERMGSFRQLGDTIRSYYSAIMQQGTRITMATEYDVLPVQQFERLKAVIPDVDWTDGSTIFRELRMIKSPYEVSRIRISAIAAHRALEQAAAHVRAGMTELELIAHIEHIFRMQGHIGMVRMRGYNQEIVTGMVASGEAGAEPTYFDGPAGGRGLTPASPQGASRKVIVPHEPILVDIGCCIDGYVIDQTRTLVIGKLDEKLQFAYEAAEAILRNTEQRLKPGTISETLYTDALALAETYKLADHFMGYGEDQVRFLGHGIGLEIDEWPVLARGFKQPLVPGMILAIEPKFTFPGLGVVGIENTYLITADGYVKLTTAPEGIIAIIERNE